MILSIVCLIGGLILILAGANYLTEGSSAVARRIGISDLIVGLTVVAFGTSAPELVISVISAIEGNAGLAVGNTVGSNIFNILAIIGITAMVRPVKVEKSIMTNEIPLVILSSAVLLVMANSPLLDGAPNAVVTRVDGIILLLFFAIFMRYTFAQAKSGGQPDDPAAQKASSTPQLPVWRSAIYIIGGLAALIYGGDLFVDGASGIARRFGVSDAVIGLTIVSIGTSLPELATSITAAIKGMPGLAIGNVIGSNIFNIFFVLGTAATITPLPLGGVGNTDLLVLAGASLLFWLFGQFYKSRTFTRSEGTLMAVGYVGYIAWLVATA